MGLYLVVAVACSTLQCLVGWSVVGLYCGEVRYGFVSGSNCCLQYCVVSCEIIGCEFIAS